MPRMRCPGLPADWLNGWLAAVGATVLDSRIRLHWTEDTPRAVLSAENVEPIEAVVESWPDAELLKDLPIAENWNGAGRLSRKVSVGAFRERARSARGHRHSWALSSTMTDLCVEKNDRVVDGEFNPPAPGGLTLHQRLEKVHAEVKQPSRNIRDSLNGQAVRVKSNGLGFDQTRLGSQSDDNEKYVDPVVEALAFFALAILPMRGNGREDAQGKGRQRGWLATSRDGHERKFMWPAWSQPLDCAGIDSLMDAWKPEKRSSWARIGVHAGWGSVERIKRGSKDVTRAFGAEPL